MRTLLVEDDRRLAALLRRGLEEAGIAVDIALTGRDALDAARATRFDAIILDVMLPGEPDGFGVCAVLRDERIQTPVLMLTARDSVDDRVRGLECGADDYLVKPFALRELIARFRALKRRHLADRAAVLRAGRLRLDTAGREVTIDGRPIELTAREFAILEFFLHHPRQLLSRTQIEEHIWRYDLTPGSNLVEVYIARLRKKLTATGVPDPLNTVRGGGYRFDDRRLLAASSGTPVSS